MQRGERRVDERPAKSLDIEIGGIDFLWSLTRNTKLYYFHLGFKRFGIRQAWNTIRPLFLACACFASSFSWRLLSLSFSVFFFFCSLFLLDCDAGANSDAMTVYWCCKFNFSFPLSFFLFFLLQIIVQKKGRKKPQKGLRSGEENCLSIFRDCACDSSWDPKYLSSPLFSLSLSSQKKELRFPCTQCACM